MEIRYGALPGCLMIILAVCTLGVANLAKRYDLHTSEGVVSLPYERMFDAQQVLDYVLARVSHQSVEAD